MRSLTRWVALPGVLFVLAGCVTTSSGGRGDAAVAPALSVERFLQAANQQDLDTMARIFGTYDGPVGDTGSTVGCAFKKMGSWIGLSDSCISRMDVELRMNTIALILRHDDYQLGQDQTVPARQHPTTMVPVTLVQGQNRIQGIPFTVVRSGSGRWLIEQIDLERITRTR